MPCRGVIQLVLGTLGRLSEMGRDRLAGEAEHRQVFDQPAGLRRQDRTNHA